MCSILVFQQFLRGILLDIMCAKGKLTYLKKYARILYKIKTINHINKKIALVLIASQAGKNLSWVSRKLRGQKSRKKNISGK